MQYKTILVHVDRSPHAATRIRIAAEMAARENAHLIGAAMTGIPRYVFEQSEVDLTRTVMANHVDALYRRADEALAQFDRIAAQAGLQSHEARRINDDDQGGLIRQARYCDLVVLSQADRSEAVMPVVSNLPEYAVLNSGRPILITPHAGDFKTVGERILVAWDGTTESTRALANAIPALRHAEKVVIAAFNSSGGTSAHDEKPEADIAQYLSRHDIRAEVMQPTTSLDIGNALLSLAADLGSDLLVMGGYGHTRLRETLMGGVTRTVLETMTIPVLMSH